MQMSAVMGCAWLALATAPGVAATDDPALIDWQPVGSFSIARTETTVAQFARFVAAAGTVTRAERRGGGRVYEAGFVQKAGWHWRTPFGAALATAGTEPAVHVSFDEAQAFCRWAGGRLPADTTVVYLGFRCLREA